LASILKTIDDLVVKNNAGRSFVVKRGQTLRIIGTSTVDFVAFNANNLRERFDQARTKVNQARIFISEGDRLISRFNSTMFTITRDLFKGQGTHDLQKGMCSKSTYDKYRDGTHKMTDMLDKLGARVEQLPMWGCWENLTEALKEYKIPPEDIPSPFNIFQTMKINGETGEMELTNIRPTPGTHIDLRAEMDCLVAISACPWYGLGDPVHVQLFEE